MPFGLDQFPWQSPFGSTDLQRAISDSKRRGSVAGGLQTYESGNSKNVRYQEPLRTTWACLCDGQGLQFRITERDAVGNPIACDDILSAPMCRVAGCVGIPPTLRDPDVIVYFPNLPAFFPCALVPLNAAPGNPPQGCCRLPDGTFFESIESACTGAGATWTEGPCEIDENRACSCVLAHYNRTFGRWETDFTIDNFRAVVSGANTVGPNTTIKVTPRCLINESWISVPDWLDCNCPPDNWNCLSDPALMPTDDCSVYVDVCWTCPMGFAGIRDGGGEFGPIPMPDCANPFDPADPNLVPGLPIGTELNVTRVATCDHCWSADWLCDILEVEVLWDGWVTFNGGAIPVEFDDFNCDPAMPGVHPGDPLTIVRCDCEWKVFDAGEAEITCENITTFTQDECSSDPEGDAAADPGRLGHPTVRDLRCIVKPVGDPLEGQTWLQKQVYVFTFCCGIGIENTGNDPTTWVDVCRIDDEVDCDDIRDAFNVDTTVPVDLMTGDLVPYFTSGGGCSVATFPDVTANTPFCDQVEALFNSAGASTPQANDVIVAFRPGVGCVLLPLTLCN